MYDYEVRVAVAGLGRPPLHRGQVTTDTLPSDLAAVHFTSLGTPTERLTMVELRGSPFSGWVIVDENGAVVWYRCGIAESFTRRANGDFVLLGITEVRPDLTVVAQLPATAEARMHHDVIATPANTLLFLAQASDTFDGAGAESGHLDRVGLSVAGMASGRAQRHPGARRVRRVLVRAHRRGDRAGARARVRQRA
ncbi:MAG: hypothetical protein ABIQ49_06235 [Gemmatimonadales bacterium]